MPALLLIASPFKPLSLVLLLMAVVPSNLAIATEAETQDPPEYDWLDKSQLYVTESGDALARWLDGFFGVPVADIESASSILRLATVVDFDEHEGDDARLKARGKLQLPNLSKRFSLVFSGADGDVSDNLATSREERGDDQVGLQYVLKERRRHRFDLFGGVRAGLKAKAGVRYRFQYAPSESFFHRFSEELAYDQDDKAISTTRLDLNYLLDDNSMTRWGNRLRYGEETDGVEWRSQLSWRERISDRRAITYFVGINGITDPNKLIKSYGPGLRYRQKVFRDYLFLDLSPAYGWRKKDADSDRQGAWSFEIQLEMFFEKQQKQ